MPAGDRPRSHGHSVNSPVAPELASKRFASTSGRASWRSRLAGHRATGNMTKGLSTGSGSSGGAKNSASRWARLRSSCRCALTRNPTCADVKERAVAKITDIEEKMRSLRRMKKALVKLTASCSGRGPVDDCPILEALDPKERKP